MCISQAQSDEGDLPSMAEKRHLERNGDQVNNNYRQRSHSLDVYEQSKAKTLIESMKHTFEFKLNEPKGFNTYRGSIRTEFVQSSFVTLEHLLTKPPEYVSFDIEISKSTRSSDPYLSK